MRILITGGAGFVGSSLALRLARSSHSVVCLDNFKRKGSELNSSRLNDAGIELVTSDVRYAESFDLEPFDLLIDAAAEPSVLAGADGKGVDYVVDTNLGGTLNLLEAARKWEAGTIFLSTSRVYPVEKLRAIDLIETESRFEISESQSVPGVSIEGISEEFPMRGAKTLYGATKYASEVMVAEYASQFDMPAIINRFGVIAGPWQMGRVDQGIVSLWVAAHHFGFSLKYVGYGGKQVRDVLHIDDMCRLIETQIEAGVEKWSGQVVNVGGGVDSSTSLLELTAMVREATGRDMEIEHDPSVRRGDVPLYVTDNSSVCSCFGWSAKRYVTNVVEDTAKWIVDNEDVLKPVFMG